MSDLRNFSQDKVHNQMSDLMSTAHVEKELPGLIDELPEGTEVQSQASELMSGEQVEREFHGLIDKLSEGTGDQNQLSEIMSGIDIEQELIDLIDKEPEGRETESQVSELISIEDLEQELNSLLEEVSEAREDQNQVSELMSVEHVGQELHGFIGKVSQGTQVRNQVSDFMSVEHVVQELHGLIDSLSDGTDVQNQASDVISVEHVGQEFHGLIDILPDGREVQNQVSDLMTVDHVEQELRGLINKLSEGTDILPSLLYIHNKIHSSRSVISTNPFLELLIPYQDIFVHTSSELEDDQAKRMCADIVSVLAAILDKNRDCVDFYLIGSKHNFENLGREFVDHLSAGVIEYWQSEHTNSALRQQLYELSCMIAQYYISIRAVAEACNLFADIERLEVLEEYVNHECYSEMCVYIIKCAALLPNPDNVGLLQMGVRIYLKFKQFSRAFLLAMQYNDKGVMKNILLTCNDKGLELQLAFIIARQCLYYFMRNSLQGNRVLLRIMSNSLLHKIFLKAAEKLDILKPLTPEGIYIINDNDKKLSKACRQRVNLAITLANGFANAGFGPDHLLTKYGNSWFKEHNEHGQLGAVACYGLLFLWHPYNELKHMDMYLNSQDVCVKSGALLGCGMARCRINNEPDVVFPVLGRHILNESNIVRVGAVLGLGLAYAGSNNEKITDSLLTVLNDAKSTMETVGMAALACGLIVVGSCNLIIVRALIKTLRTSNCQQSTFARFVSLGIGLCVLGNQEISETVKTELDVISGRLRSMTFALVDACAYAGTGDAFKIEEMYNLCCEPDDDEDDEVDYLLVDDDDFVDDDSSEEEDFNLDMLLGNRKYPSDTFSKQAIAVLGIAMISKGDDIDQEMATGIILRAMHVKDPIVRRSIPLALGLLYVSNPNINVVNFLIKLTSDQNSEVALNAIFAMGLVGAGTRNGIIKYKLDDLETLYAEDYYRIYIIKISKGLVHLGKGALTLSTHHSEEKVLNYVALSAILSAVIGFQDVKNLMLGPTHYLFFTLIVAIQPRILITFDEKFNLIPIPVKIGRVVDHFNSDCELGKIDDFKILSTPVILHPGERAELYTEEYLSLSPVMEGVVILRKIK